MFRMELLNISMPYCEFLRHIIVLVIVIWLFLFLAIFCFTRQPEIESRAQTFFSLKIRLSQVLKQRYTYPLSVLSVLLCLLSRLEFRRGQVPGEGKLGMTTKSAGPLCMFHV